MQSKTEHMHLRKTYPQNWPAYNAAQTTEKEHFLHLLKDLCAYLPNLPQQIKGRPRVPVDEAIFAICYKIYSTVSGRRFMTDLRNAQAAGYISKTPHFNSLFNYLENPEMTPLLKRLILMTSLPFTAIEKDFAADSSGFTTATYSRWYDHKYGTLPERKEWVKVHIMTGVKTHTVTAVEILGQHTHDTKPFKDLLKTTAENFTVQEVSGDKAYASSSNMEAVDKLGGVPYLMFKIDSGGGKGGIWTKMFHYFHLNQEEFLKHYHKRSNVESTFSMIKTKFGGAVRSKTEVSRINECLCKIICHNICVFIHEMTEMGMDIKCPIYFAMPEM